MPQLDNSHGANNLPGPEQRGTLLEARKKAQAAILRLWPLEVRFQDYVDEGIDEKVVHALFASLGLDTKSARSGHNDQSQVPPPSETHTSTSEAAQPTGPAQARKGAAPVSEAQQPARGANPEERKDRIARRLMAAKAAKQTSPGENTQTGLTAGGTQPSASSEAPCPASTSQANTTADSSASAEAARKKAEKERLLQEKLAKLQQSRALRAQKASEKAGAAAAPQEPSSHVRSEGQASVPPASAQPATGATALQDVGPAKEVPVSTQPAPPIPGLFLSSSDSPLVNPRKRPVASDLNENAAAPPYKRTFNQHYVEKPLIINVSDGSDDEDVEMDMSSPVDGPASEHPSAGHAPPRSSPLRDHPPLADKPIRRGLGRSASRTSNGTGVRDHDNAKLGHLTQNISELKQKIAELQRQKSAKAASKESPAQSSNGTPAAETRQPPMTDATPTRDQSVGSSSARPETTAPAEPDVQRIFPVPGASPGSRSDRREQIRIFSNKLPTLDASIATMVAKERLLESQLKRAREEADKLRSQRDLTRQQLERLQAEENASPEPQAKHAQPPKDQQEPNEHGPSPSGDREDPAAQAAPLVASPDSNSAANRHEDAAPASSDEPLPEPDSKAACRSEDSELVEAPSQGVGPPDEGGVMVQAEEDTATDEPPPMEEPQQTSGASSQSPADDALHIDTALDGDEAYSQPEPPTEHETDARELRAEILSPALADDTTPPILAKSDSPNSGTESASLPQHISKEVSDAADDEQGLPQQVHDGRPAETASNLTSSTQSESTLGMPSRTGFVPYESVLKGFLSYRFHPNFRKDVAGGLKSPTYSNKINPQVQFCLDFLLGTCTRGSSCKYQHIDAVGISGKCPDFSNND